MKLKELLYVPCALHRQLVADVSTFSQLLQVGFIFFFSSLYGAQFTKH